MRACNKIPPAKRRKVAATGINSRVVNASRTIRDRVVLRNGEFGQIIRIDDGMAQVQLDSSVRKTAATAALKKVECDDQAMPEDHCD